MAMFGKKKNETPEELPGEDEQESEGDHKDSPDEGPGDPPDASTITKAFAAASGKSDYVPGAMLAALRPQMRLELFCLSKAGQRLPMQDAPDWLLEIIIAMAGEFNSIEDMTPVRLTESYTRYEAALMARDHGTQES